MLTYIDLRLSCLTLKYIMTNTPKNAWDFAEQFVGFN